MRFVVMLQLSDVRAKVTVVAWRNTALVPHVGRKGTFVTVHFSAVFIRAHILFTVVINI